MYKKKTHIHFVGIGGIGMSGIAKILKHQGYQISGCDVDLEQKSVIDLINLGCKIYEGNNNPNCHDPSIDVLVYSSAIKSDNPEILAAQRRGIPTISRALMLAELMRMKYSIAVSGMHGKTTTTSLISHILFHANYDPTVIIGGHLKSISTNAHFGSGDFLVAEADESDKSLTKLYPTLAVITNIDREHLDVYNNLDDIKNTFLHFLGNIPFYGAAILCNDDPNIRSLLPLNYPRIITYGLSNNSDLFAKELLLENDYSEFKVYKADNLLGEVTLKMPGKHNVLNSLAATAIALELNIPFDKIAAALSSFNGVDRRFTFRGTYKQAEIFDDYGHHPVEIDNILSVAKNRAKKGLTVVFQPHRYTRTFYLWDDFIKVFSKNKIDNLIITDIYPASESPIDNVDSKRLVEAIKKETKANVFYAPIDENFKEIKNIVDNIESQDLILLLGAGKVYKFAEKLTENS